MRIYNHLLLHLFLEKSKMSECLSLNNRLPRKCFENLNCFETCTKGQVCTVFYQNKTGELQPGFAGCWHNKEEDGFCNPDYLTHIDCHLRHKGSPNGIDSYMCCCTGNRCNNNLIKNETLMKPTPTTPTTSKKNIPFQFLVDAFNGYKEFKKFASLYKAKVPREDFNM